MGDFHEERDETRAQGDKRAVLLGDIAPRDKGRTWS